MVDNLVKKVLENGGKIAPLILPFEYSNGTGQMNPSIYLDGGKIICNLRNVQYVMIHSENEQRFHSRYGPLLYVHPENDVTLRTTNFYLELDSDYKITRINKVDTSKLDIPPVWEFIGLEDARLVRWEDKLYMIGVRRDTKPNGEGRMEFSEIIVEQDTVKEISRKRIEPPKQSYCEKNWMPILAMPYHFVKWSNPTEVVKVNIEEGTSETIYLENHQFQGYRDFRGGSQVVQYGEYKIALIHEVILFFNELHQKDTYYYHRFLVWDKDWKLVKISEDFHFIGARVEFCCGLAIKEDKVLISFGYQDNTCFILEMPVKIMEEMIHE